jgi:hypothetical protein
MPESGCGYWRAEKNAFRQAEQVLKDNIPDGLIDLHNPATVLPEDHDHASAPGYIGIHDKKIELWFSHDRFEKIAGGKRKGQALKKKLGATGRLMVWGGGRGRRAAWSNVALPASGSNGSSRSGRRGPYERACRNRRKPEARLRLKLDPRACCGYTASRASSAAGERLDSTMSIALAGLRRNVSRRRA